MHRKLRVFQRLSRIVRLIVRRIKLIRNLVFSLKREKQREGKMMKLRKILHARFHHVTKCLDHKGVFIYTLKESTMEEQKRKEMSLHKTL